MSGTENTSRRSRTSCAYRGCSRETKEGISLFSFPKEPERAKIWLEACYRSDLLPKIRDLHKNHRLCERHFEEKYLSKTTNTRKRLFPQAVPTLFAGVLKRILQSTIDVNEPGKCKQEPEQEPPTKILRLSDGSINPALEEGSVKHQPSTYKEPLSSIYDDSINPSLDIKPVKQEPSTSEESLPSIYDIPTSTGPNTSKHVQWEYTINLRLSTTEGKTASTTLPPSTSAQTSLQLNSGTPRNEKLTAKLKSLQTLKTPQMSKPTGKDQEMLQDLFILCDTLLSEPLCEIVKTHAALKYKPPLALRYTIELKQ